jgi:hypothetical protein
MSEQPNSSEVRARAKLAAELLPPGAQRERLRAALERILAQPSRTRAELICYHTERAQVCRWFAEQLPTLDCIQNRDALFDQIAEQEQQEQRLVETYKRMSANYPRKFMRQVELLQAWEAAGGNLDYEGRGRKKRDDPHYPVPTGAVVSFLQATAGVKAGTTHNIIVKYSKLHLKPIALPGAGSLLIREDEQHFYFVDKHGRKVYRDGRDESDPDHGLAM